jgi:hypothetical protein
MKQYIGYIEKESPLRYEVKENEINKPLPVYATDEKIKSVEANWYFYIMRQVLMGKKKFMEKNALNAETIIFRIGNVWQMSQRLK